MQCHVTVCFMIVLNNPMPIYNCVLDRQQRLQKLFQTETFYFTIEKGLLFKGFNFNIREFSDWFDTWDDDGPKHELSKVVLCPTSEND